MQSHLSFPFFAQRRIHLGVCGSIAAYKALDLLRLWHTLDLKVGVTLSTAAREFIQPLCFESLGANPVYTSMFGTDETVFAHLEPGQNAEVLVIAPATANTIAKLAMGLGDDLLSCQALAFSGPVIIAPAMNPALWEAPATKENCKTLTRRGVILLDPECGTVACGDTGKGRLPVLENIYLHALKSLSPQDLAGKKILITLGPTREFWDAVRFWSNPSTGRMGASLALAAWLRGADVHVISGPSDLWFPDDIQVNKVNTAREMFELCQHYWPLSDIGCLTAAVCDFRPQHFGKQKFKKANAGPDLNITFNSNPDILFSLGSSKKQDQLLIGFAAESEDDLETPAQIKLQNKNLDLILANQIGKPETGFAHSSNKVLALDRYGQKEQWPILEKTVLAWRVWDWIHQILI